MISNEQLNQMLEQASQALENRLSRKFSYNDHSQLAELYFSRAEIHLAAKNYVSALQDFESCLDYDPYFHEADLGREHVHYVLTQGLLRVAS